MSDDEDAEALLVRVLISHGGGVSGMRADNRGTGNVKLGLGCSVCGGETRGGSVRRNDDGGEWECGRVGCGTLSLQWGLLLSEG